MYKIENINIGEKIKYYRKLANLTLSDIGKNINKSKSTISKYESNQIIPDAITLLELCNCLKVSLNDFFTIEEEKTINDNNNNIFNPFKTNQLFLYYYTDRTPITSMVCLSNSNKYYKCEFYNGIKNSSNFHSCSYFYEGILETNEVTAFFTFHNSLHKNQMFEKVQIIVNVPWSNNISIYKGLLLGLTPNSLPIAKKIILSSSEIQDIHKYDKFLKFSKEDLDKIYNDNALIIENKNYDELFYDF